MVQFSKRGFLLAVQNHFSVHHDRDVPPILNKLHHFLARARHQRPSRFGFRILLYPHKRLPVKDKCHLSQPLRLTHRDGIIFRAELHDVAILDENLAPHSKQSVFECH